MNDALNGLAQRNAFSAFFVLIIRAVILTVGLMLIMASIPIGILTPFPFVPIGAFVFLFGLVLVAGASKTLHTKITNALRRVPWLWKRVRFAFGEGKTDPDPAE